MSGVFNPILRLTCLDASIAASHIFKHFKNVIIASGALSPVEIYPKSLNFVPTNIIEISITLNRNSIPSSNTTKGNDQMLLKNMEDDDYERYEAQKKYLWHQIMIK